MVESKGVTIMKTTEVKIETELEEIKRKIGDYWKDAGEEYDNYPGFDTEEEKEEWKRFLSNEISGNKLRILDAGTGTGFLALPLAEMGYDVVGIDLSEGMLSRAVKKAKERGLNLDLRMGDVESLDFDDGSFDVVVSRWVLWTLTQPEKAIEEWMRVLKPGGWMYAFGSKEPGRKGRLSWFKANFGRIAITVLERRNAWARSDYDKDVKENLPLHYDKAGPDEEVKLLKKAGFTDVNVIDLGEVNRIHGEKSKEVPLRYKLTWPGNEWCCIKGRKSEA